MKFFVFAGCATALAFSACAQETQQPAGPVPAAPQPQQAAAPIMAPPGGPLPQGPAAPATQPKGMPSQQISEDFMKLVMEASAKIEEAKHKIQERENFLIENDPAIKKLQARLEDLQKQINAIIEADAEYAKLKLKRDIKTTVIPDLPKPAGGPMGSHPMMPPPGMRAPMPPLPPANK